MVALVAAGAAAPIGRAVVAAYAAATGLEATVHDCRPVDGAGPVAWR